MSTGWQPLRRVARPRDAVDEAFVRLALTHALVMAGDAMVTVALAGSLFFSISPTAARSKVALSLLFTMLPFGIVAPFLGPAIDRSRAGRRVMLVAAAAGRVLFALLMARWLKSLLLFPAALGLLVLSKGHAVAKASLVPGTVHSNDELVKANGRLAIVAAIVGFAAAGPAAAILKLVGAAWVLRVAAVLYIAGALTAVRCRPVPPPPSPALDLSVDQNRLSRGVTAASSAMAALRGVVGFVTFAVAFDFRRHHAPSWWFGAVIAASLAGTFVGAILGPRLRAVVREERMLLGALSLVTIVAVIAGRVDTRPLVAALAFTVGLCSGGARLAFDAIVQRDGLQSVQGRSFARFEATFQLAWVGAALVPVVIPIPGRAAYFVLAAGTGVAAIAYATGRRPLGAAARLARLTR